MLLTPTLRRAVMAFALAVIAPVAAPLRAQDAGGNAAGAESVRAPGPRRLQPAWHADARGFGTGRAITCDSSATCSGFLATAVHGTRDQEPPATADQRGKFGLVGLVVGAAVGWGVYAYQCTHGSDCYSPVGGVLLAAAGGVVGLLIGVLIAPGPASR